MPSIIATAARCVSASSRFIAERMVQVKAVAEFTEDMVKTLGEHFRSYAVWGVVYMEVTTYGLWLVHPMGGVSSWG